MHAAPREVNSVECDSGRELAAADAAQEPSPGLTEGESSSTERCSISAVDIESPEDAVVIYPASAVQWSFNVNNGSTDNMQALEAAAQWLLYASGCCLRACANSVAGAVALIEDKAVNNVKISGKLVETLWRPVTTKYFNERALTTLGAAQGLLPCLAKHCWIGPGGLSLHCSEVELPEVTITFCGATAAQPQLSEAEKLLSDLKAADKAAQQRLVVEPYKGFTCLKLCSTAAVGGQVTAAGCVARGVPFAAALVQPQEVVLDLTEGEEAALQHWADWNWSSPASSGRSRTNANRPGTT